MARINLQIIEALRKTAKSIQNSDAYQWGHMGSCNYGFLAQHITQLRKEDIHTCAMRGHGDWTEQLNDYCPTSGLPMDDLISQIISFGFDACDLKDLEKLSGREILAALPEQGRHLSYNVKADVVCYLETWAGLIENELLKKIKISSIVFTEKV